MHSPIHLRSLRWLTLLLPLLAACATVPATVEPVETGDLVFWEATPPDGGAVVHLLGTVHASRNGFEFDPAISRALAASDTLVMELAPDETEQGRILDLMRELGFLQGRQLPEVVSAETWDATVAFLERYGMPPETVIGMKPWLAMVTLLGVQFQAEGISQEGGIEHTLTAEAAQKPIVGLETARSQFGVFDELSLESQEFLLLDLVRQDHEATTDSVDLLVRAWELGDLDAIEAMVLSSAVPEAASVNETLYHERNRQMAARVSELSTGGGRWFVAVGMGHMVGASGIPTLLAERGFQVVRVPQEPMSEQSIHDSVYVSPGCQLYGRIAIGEGSSVWPNCVIRAECAEVRVGRMTNLQDFVMVHVGYDDPTIIGDFCSITHHATIHGATIEDHCLVGINAVVMDGARIGRGSIVAPGAVVTEGTQVPPGSIVAGVPAKVIKQRDSARENRENAWNYWRNAQAYLHGNHRAWDGPEFATFRREIREKLATDADL